jgi:hypothetical protein
MSPKWFWTAMTRGVSLKNIYIYLGQEQMCDVLDTCHNVSIWLLDRAAIWLGEA